MPKYRCTNAAFSGPGPPVHQSTTVLAGVNQPVQACRRESQRGPFGFWMRVSTARWAATIGQRSPSTFAVVELVNKRFSRRHVAWKRFFQPVARFFCSHLASWWSRHIMFWYCKLPVACLYP
ncbi:hypothetical protein TEQG_00487 [Trichophyton equinum CBS 127.97]|uniref:Uncharacterized protein n=1 Tax=Trichophyton equinum (strain ATCC MYA-4606 / CBS 127.97) TaxID=559882 RepID=F2PIP9_TRIEC|nr:hypothetical protein TEQG_00487 [Trichophyton equinum CBS 127.97]